MPDEILDYIHQADRLISEALERQSRVLDVERLATIIEAQQPKWQHSLLVGKSGMPAVISEQP